MKCISYITSCIAYIYRICERICHHCQIKPIFLPTDDSDSVSSITVILLVLVSVSRGTQRPIVYTSNLQYISKYVI